MNKTAILYGIIVALALLSGYLYFSSRDVLDNEPFDTSLNPEPYFMVSDNLVCTIKKSTNNKEIGTTLSLIGIKTDEPKLLSGDSITSPLNKSYESDDTITMGLVASGSGSTDILVLNKKTGEFARTSSGNLFGIYAYASKGTCK